MVMLPDARVPAGLRLYAIGDVHGHAGLLGEIHARIGRDLESRPPPDWRVIHLGDYIDRGPDSAGVLGMLLRYGARGRSAGRTEFLMGNHDRFLLDFLRDPEGADLELWMMNGGSETLRSFGIEGTLASYWIDLPRRRRIRDGILEAMPDGLTEFLGGLSLMIRHGDYAFVHAGVRPGVPLEDQDAHDLLWIRDPFLSSGRDHGAVIVHGHTPVREVKVRPNRIGMDTGAAYDGPLTCLVLEGSGRHLLGPGGPEPLPEPV